MHEDPQYILKALSQIHPQHRALAEALAKTPEVLRVLSEANIRWVSIGAAALAEYVEPRATSDLDLLVPVADLQPALETIKTHFGQVKVTDETPYRVKIEGSVSVDLVGASTVLYEAVLRRHRLRDDLHIATPEQLAAMKYAAILSPNRGQAEKYQDKSDLFRLALSAIKNFRSLRRLGDLVGPDEGGRLVQLARDIRAGRPVEI